MSKTTTKLFAGGVALALYFAPMFAHAGVQAVLPLVLSAASVGADSRTAVAQADDLLREARQAMSEGSYEIADSKIARAEKLQPKYSLFHTGDTPKKARADLDRVMTQKAVASDPNLKNAPSKGNHPSGVPADPFQQHQAQPGTDSANGAPATGTKPINSTNSAAPSSASNPLGSPAGSPATRRDPSYATPSTGPASLSQPLSASPLGLRTPGSTVVGAAGGTEGARSGISSDRDSPNPWEVDGPKATAATSSLPVASTPVIASPVVRTPISGITPSGITPSESSPRDNLPRDINASSPTIVGPTSGEGFAGRDPLPTMRAIDPGGRYAGTEPQQLRVDPAAAPLDSSLSQNKQRAADMTKKSRAALGQGDLATAEQIARQAELLVPDTAYEAGEDRPTLVLLDIQRGKRGGAARAVATAPVSDNRSAVSSAVYDPNNDTTQNIVAGATMPKRHDDPTPENGTGEGQRWYKLGTEAMAHSNNGGAIQDFRRAYVFQSELDPNTRRQLYDYMKILGMPFEPMPSSDGPADAMSAVAQQPTVQPLRTPMAPGAFSSASPSAVPQSTNYGQLAANSSPPGLIAPGSIAAASSGPSASAPPAVLDNIPTPSPVATGQNLARQVGAEVARQQSLARDMKEKQPKQALESLQKTRDMVATIQGLDSAPREQLLKRLDLGIEEMQKYIAKNAPQIEMDDKNRKIEEEVNNKRKQKVVVDDKLAYIVNDFNKAIEEQRYTDAQVLAKKATELDPTSTLVMQLNVTSRMSARMAQIDQIRSGKEEALIDTLAKVDEAAIMPHDDFNMPDAKSWARLSGSKFRRQRDGQTRLSPKEKEIEQRLNTPMALKFDRRPLTEVLAYMSKISGVSIFADPQGLQTEGVTSDTAVTIDLSQDISLKSALNLILAPLHLTYVIKNEVLTITSESIKRNEIYEVVYPVGDLVTRIPNFTPNGREGINAAMREAYARQGVASGGGAFGMAGPLTVAANDTGTNTDFAANPAILAQMQRPGLPLIGSGSTSSGTPQTVPFGPGGLKGGAQADFDSLISLIKSTVDKETWDDTGGNGSIESFATNLSLVVSQTQEVHEKIADLLAQLRRLQDLQVTIEVRFITLEDDFFERMGVDFNFNIANNAATVTPAQIAAAGPPQSFFSNLSPNAFNPSKVVGLDPGGTITAAQDIQYRAAGLGTVAPPFAPVDAGAEAATFGFAILSDIQAFFVVQAAQSDIRSNILQAPKVTLFNGQQASVADVTQEPFVISVTPVVGDFAAAQQPVIVVLSQGTSLTVQAVVSNDRRFVRLTVVPFFSQIGAVNTFTFNGSTSTTKKSSDSKSGSTDTSTSADDETTSTGTTVQLPQFSFVTVSTTVSVPDGGTVLLGGIKRLEEGRTERGVPILSKLPYINRLFRNSGIGRQTSSLMMMVTPRIIIQEEEAAALEGQTTGTP